MARKIKTNSELNPKSDLDLLREVMAEKEAGREETAELGELQRERIAEHHKTSAPDMAKSAAQTLTLEFGDEAIGALTAGYQKATGDERPYEEIYEESRDAVRQSVAKARADTPVGTFMADVVMPNPLKFAKYAKGIKRVGRAFSGPVTASTLYGSGASEGETAGDVAVDAGLGAGIGLATKAISKIAGAPFGSPSETEGRYVGMDRIPKGDLPQDPLRLIDDVEASTKRLRDQGFFSRTKDLFNTDKNTMMMSSKRRGLMRKDPRAASPKDILKKFNRTVRKADSKIKTLLSSASPSHVEDAGQLGLFGGDSTKFRIFSSKDISEKGEIKKLIEGVYEKMGEPGELSQLRNVVERSWKKMSKGSSHVTLTDLHNEKQRLYRLLDSDYNKANLKDAEKVVMKKLAKSYKDIINNSVESDQIRNLNQTMEDVYTFKRGLENKITGDFISSPAEGLKHLEQPSLWKRAGQGLEQGIDVTRPYRSKATRMYEAVPEQMRDIFEGPAGLLPARTMLRPEGGGREPQSIPNIPEELIHTMLPRNADALIQNQDVLLAKVAQQVPEMYDGVEMILKRHPERLKELLPAIITAVPAMFEYDKYNRVDGIIMGPEDKTMARRDIMRNDNLTNTEKIEKIDLINKTGEYYE